MRNDGTEMTEQVRPGVRRREGIALVLVLGMLALLMLIAVTFSITMRMERDGAGSYSSMVASKQLIEAAVAHAIETIDESMDAASEDYIFPTWTVLPSGGLGSPVNLAWGEALEHIPGALRADVQAAQSQWLEASVSGGTRARVAYLVVNVSDMLDATYSGGKTRFFGADGAAEVGVERLAEIRDITALRTQRLMDTRYDSLAEFNFYQEGKGLHTGLIGSNFTVFAEALPEYLSAVGPVNGVRYDDPFPITGLAVGELDAARTGIIARLRLAGIDPQDASFVFDALIDYVDTDSVPQNLASPCTERVPMINEVGFRVKQLRINDTALMMRMRVELIYPFIAPADHTFSLKSEITFELKQGATVLETWDLADVRDSGYQAGVDVRSYHVVDIPPHSHTFAEPLSNGTYTVSLWYKGQVLGPGGTPVDEVPSPYATTDLDDWLSWSTNLSHTAGTTHMLDFPSWETIDPRFNWKNHTDFWRPYGVPAAVAGDTFTPDGKINSATEFLLAAGRVNRSLGLEWDLAMHVSDAGKLYSVGELGFLPRSKLYPAAPGNKFKVDGRLKTIRLIDYVNGVGAQPGKPLRADRVLDYFSSHADAVSYRGLINPNTLSANRLACAFRKMPRTPPGMTPTPPLFSHPDDINLANRLVTWRKKVDETWTWSGGTEKLPTRFDTLSALGRYDWRSDPLFSGPPDVSDVEIESFLANSAGLMATRQNMFVVIVAAKPFSLGMGIAASEPTQLLGTWMGIRRALVLLQRDPYPTQVSTGVWKHRTRVYNFKWLSDD